MRTRHGSLIKKNGKYHMVVGVDGRKIWKSTGTSNLRDAEKKLSEFMKPFVVMDDVQTLKAIQSRLEMKAAEGLPELAPAPKREKKIKAISIPQAWNVYAKHPDAPDSGERTLKQYEAELDRFRKWIQKERPSIRMMRDVTKNVARDYARHLSGLQFSASTYNQHVAFLRRLWNVLADEAQTTMNPWATIKGKTLTPAAFRREVLTPEQFEALLTKTASDPDLHDLFVVLAWTGLRLFDAVHMKEGNLDLKRRIVTVTPKKTERKSGITVTIPLFPEALEVFRRRLDNKVADPLNYVFPALVEEYAADNSALSKRITTAFTDAGMKSSAERQGRGRCVIRYGAHSLRHHFVTAARDAGIRQEVIQNITGHQTAKMLAHYTHIDAETIAAIAAKIGGAKALTDKPKTISIDAVRAIAEKMSAKTWKAAKEELLTLTA